MCSENNVFMNCIDPSSAAIYKIFIYTSKQDLYVLQFLYINILRTRIYRNAMQGQ